MGQLWHSCGSKHVGGGNGFIWPPFVRETLVHSLNPTASQQLAVASSSWRCSGLWGSFGDMVPKSWSRWHFMMRMGARWLLCTPAWMVVVAHTQSCHCAASALPWRHHPWYEVLAAGSMHLWQMSLLQSQKAWMEEKSLHLLTVTLVSYEPDCGLDTHALPLRKEEAFRSDYWGDEHPPCMVAWVQRGCWHGGHYQQVVARWLTLCINKRDTWLVKW